MSIMGRLSIMEGMLVMRDVSLLVFSRCSNLEVGSKISTNVRKVKIFHRGTASGHHRT